MKAVASFSDHPESYIAGQEAAKGPHEHDSPPVLAIVFTTDKYNAEQVLDGIRSILPSCLIAGFCCGGVITASGLHYQGVGILSLSGDLQAVTTLQKGLSRDPHAVGQKAGSALLQSGIKNGTVIVLPDGFQADLSKMLHGLYNQAGPDFQYIGGGAGDNLKFFKTYQFTESTVASDAVAAALVEGLDIGLGAGHGWIPIGDPLIITRAAGKTVYEIDGAPAFPEYCRRLGITDKAQFPSAAMRHPLGFPDISGRYVIRDPLCANEDDSILFVTEVPSQAVGHIMDCTIKGLVDKAETVAKQAITTGSEPLFMLLFDCISRVMLMENRFQEEIRVLQETVGPDVPMLGALTFGEVGSYGNTPLFHNKTTVVAVGSRRRM